MSEKSLLQDIYFTVLRRLGIKFYHINGRARKYMKAFFPDLMFTYKDKLYLREFGLKSSGHSDRKDKQMEYMTAWKDQAPKITDIRIIYTQDEMNDDFKKLGFVGGSV